MKSFRAAFLLPLLACCIPAAPAQTVVREWGPEQLAAWSGGGVRKGQIRDAALELRSEAGDPIWSAPVFDAFAASPWQVLELTMKSDVSGPAEIYWTGTTQTQYGGFSGEKRTPFEVIGDGQFRTYRLEPFWQAERQIIRLRLDFPAATAGSHALRSLRVVEEASGAPVNLPLENPALKEGGSWSARVALRAEENPFVHLRLAVASGETAVLSFAASQVNGLTHFRFPLRADGRMHTYNLEVATDKGWVGEIVGLRLDLGQAPGAKPARVESISAGPDVLGGPDLQVRWMGLADPWPRAGRPARFEALLVNHGGEPARGVRPELALNGARLLETGTAPDTVEFEAPQTYRWTVQADRPGEAEARLTLPGGATHVAKLQFGEAVDLPKAAYVPEPKPAKSDYQVGAYLFPGWNNPAAWARIKPYPERQPLLGWYREESPEVADWQIKWAVEHGISFFLYDWYWDRGRRHLEHGLHSALFNSRYQDRIKFCLLYANHNRPGSHSAEDFEAIARFWIENYFKRSNYLQVDGKPVIVMFAPMNPHRDMGGAPAVKASFEKMRAMCREAGLGGIYFVACTSPDVQRLPALQEMGYDAVTAYNWPSLNMTPAEQTARRAPYAACAEGYSKAWNEIAAANRLKLIPPVSGGWDARPWHGETTLVRTGRNPDAFRKHLEDCKRFLDNQEQPPKLRMLFVEAWNEWGEGSYIEPHREFGFGYLEAIRQVFAPDSPKPASYVPADYGLGPYDIPEVPETTVWDFSRAADSMGWTGGGENLRVEGGALRFITRGRDPILSNPGLRFRAARFEGLEVRMKVSRGVTGQLFWARHGTGLSEAASVQFPIPGDGAFHDLRIVTGSNPHWRGFVKELRLDPGNEEGVEVAIESIRLIEPAPGKAK